MVCFNFFLLKKIIKKNNKNNNKILIKIKNILDSIIQFSIINGCYCVIHLHNDISSIKHHIHQKLYG